MSNMISMATDMCGRLTVTRWVPPIKQELLTLQEHLGTTSFFSGVRVVLSLSV